MNILGIESSCDDTAAAVLTSEGIRSNVIASQSVHLKFGGVVPELASRAHHKTIDHTVQQALTEAGLDMEDIDLIAVTQGPGLLGSLLVGVCFAKGLSLSHRISLIGVNHMDAHIYANFIDHQPEYPFICLTVSGGHTQLVLVTAPFEHTLLGTTRDDAAGEAFDKIGKIMGLPYPAGPLIDRLSLKGDIGFHRFPRALEKEGLDFSFSGLKTSVLYFLQEKSEQWIRERQHDIAASVSDAITSVLITKLRRAAEQYDVKAIAIAGGVSANSMLRNRARELADAQGLDLFIPAISYCTDNAAMIAITGRMRAEAGYTDDLDMKPFASIS